MIIYHFDPFGKYTGASEEPELVPFSTSIAPPSFHASTEIPVWLGDGFGWRVFKLLTIHPPIEDKSTRFPKIKAAVQSFLDTKAKERGYDSMVALCTYALSEKTKFKAEAETAMEWRDNVWEYCHQALADVEAGTRPDTITPDSIVQELPTLTWPSAK